MVCAEEEPQQFQSSSSMRFIPRIRADFIMERLLSAAVVAREQPGKYEKSFWLRALIETPSNST
jgi:hypothetical protein